ncbi:MAG: PH domain-containing protein [Bacilli bacterium]|jgi:membrane protein YdbS with pleckstrin-like domain
MKDKFKDILTKDEEIVEVYKPHKGRFFISPLRGFLITWLFIFLMYVILFFGLEAEENAFAQNGIYIVLYVLLGLLALSLILTLVFTNVGYKKRFYAYTNKRIIVRSGVIGVDYKSLDIVQIGAIEVRVDFLDKLFKSETGTIRFGSMANPIGGQQGVVPFSFHFVEKPYKIYRTIKEDMDSRNSVE